MGVAVVVRVSATLLVSLLLAAGLSTAALSPAVAAGSSAALIAPDDLATGDPEPPDGSPVPDGLDEAPPVPDETIIDFPPAGPGVVPNANNIPIAWLGGPGDRPLGGPVLTLQNAINTVTDGGTITIDANGYAFTGAITVSHSVTIDSTGAATIYGRITVSAGTLRFGSDVAVGVANTGAAISVTGDGVSLIDIEVRNTNNVARPTGVQLAAGISGVVIDHLAMDGAGVVSSYGINLTTGSATIIAPDLSGVATGITVAAAAPTSDISITGGRIDAATSGISLGAATAPEVSGIEVVGLGVGGATPATGTGIDLATSSGAIVDDVTVSGFTRGIGASPTSTALGPVITDATILAGAREGIALGATVGPSVVRADITGIGASQSTGIVVLRATGAVIDDPTIVGMMYGITTHLDNVGAGPIITSPTITAFGAITLGSTQGASVTDSVLDAGSWGANGTGINLVNAGNVTVRAETATGFLYAIGSQSSMNADSNRSGISISDVTVTGAPTISNGIYLLGAIDATISNVDADVTGPALVIHLSQGVDAEDIVVHGNAGLTSASGSAILRAYGSEDVNVDRSSIDGGSYGFFYSGTDGSTITNATVQNLTERAVYGRSVAHLEVSDSTFTGNAAVGLFVVTDPQDGISHDIALHDIAMTDNHDGIHVLQGTTGVQIEDNTVSGQPNVVTAGGAHDLLIAGNGVDQGAGAVAIVVAPLWADGALPGSYSSSGIEVSDNTFSGGGTWISVGSPDPSSSDAGRRTLRDPVRVAGNVFPAASTAIVTYANAVVGTDAASQLGRALPIDGPLAVDARDYDNPNDWGSECRATGYLDGESYYDGGGAIVEELTAAPVMYPMNCIDLSLTEAVVGGTPAVHPGDLVTWTLTPHNAGPRVTPAGSTITQLLPSDVELVSMSGDGYVVSGLTATSDEELAVDADGPVLTVVVRIVSLPSDASLRRDVAYIAPPPTSDLDADGFADPLVERTSPLVIPTLATDTDATATDNDAQGSWALAAGGGGSADLAGTGADLGRTLAIVAVLLGMGLLASRHARKKALAFGV